VEQGQEIGKYLRMRPSGIDATALFIPLNLLDLPDLSVSSLPGPRSRATSVLGCAYLASMKSR
jgi:hypothetical protein